MATIRCPASAGSSTATGSVLLRIRLSSQAPTANLGQEATSTSGVHSTNGPLLLGLTYSPCWTKCRDSNRRRCCAGVWRPEAGNRTKRDAYQGWGGYGL